MSAAFTRTDLSSRVDLAPTDELSTADSTAPDRMRLLHVEDNPADAMLTQEYIRGVVADVEFINAVRLADVTPERAAEATCALLDLSLPDASGLDALHALRALSDTLPIIVLTGFDDFEVGLSAIRDGAEDYLIKNYVDGQMLDRAIRYAIERRRLTVELVDAAGQASAAVTAAAEATAAAKQALRAQQQAKQQAQENHDHHVKAAPGTHLVAVGIDPDTGDYALTCESCSWQADRGDEALVSWAERSLDQMLVRHVTVGARTPPAPAPERRRVSAVRAPLRQQVPAAASTAESEESEESAESVARRDLFALRKWSRRP